MQGEIAMNERQRERRGVLGLEVFGDERLGIDCEEQWTAWPQHDQHRRAEQCEAGNPDPRPDADSMVAERLSAEERRSDRRRSHQDAGVRAELAYPFLLVLQRSPRLLEGQLVSLSGFVDHSANAMRQAGRSSMQGGLLLCRREGPGGLPPALLPEHETQLRRRA